MLPPAQRRNASVRGGGWRGDTEAVHEAVQVGRRSCGVNRRGNEGIFTTGRNVTASSSAPPPNSPSNGEVEGPADAASRAQVERSSPVATCAAELAPRAHNHGRVTAPSNDC